MSRPCHKCGGEVITAIGMILPDTRIEWDYHPRCAYLALTEFLISKRWIGAVPSIEDMEAVGVIRQTVDEILEIITSIKTDFAEVKRAVEQVKRNAEQGVSQ